VSALTASVSVLPELAHRPRLLVRTSVRLAPGLVRGWWLTLLLALLAGVGRVVAPLSVQRAVDTGLDRVGTAVAVGGLGVVVAGTASYLLNRRVQAGVEGGIAELRRRGLRRAHDMPASDADRVPSAELVSRLTSDLDQTTTFLQGGGIQLVTNATQLLVAGAVMTVYSWVLTVPVVLLAVALLLVMRALQRVVAARFDRARRALAQMQTAVAESVVGMPVIRSTGSDDRVIARVDRAVDHARDSLLRTLTPLHSNTSLGELAISTMTVTVVVGGVWWGQVGDPATPRVTPGQVVAMVFLVTLFVRPLQFLVQALGEAQNALTGWRRALELAVTPSGVVADGVALPPGPVGVTTRALSAAYGDGPLVLHDVTVDVRPGEHVAVVGATGSGKSTFAKVLTRRVLPSAGEVLLSGVPLDRLTDASLARRVVIVPQDPFLFRGTVRDNVALGRPGCDDRVLLDVVGRLGLTGWLQALDQGLDTEVGHRGDRLSVGERQLVALVRTALADPDLVVLDEATSAVDPATDLAVQRALAVVTAGRTTISIAHRMVTAERADRVLVFDAGRVVQDGTHTQLVAGPGRYADLVAAWSRTAADEEEHS
jgi:ATP-binding cassette, subfamily B, bacterial